MQQSLYLLIAFTVMGFILMLVMGMRSRHANRAMLNAVANNISPKKTNAAKGW